MRAVPDIGHGHTAGPDGAVWAPRERGARGRREQAGGRSGVMTESHLSQEIVPDTGVTEGSATSIETDNGHLENGTAASAEATHEPVAVAEPEAADLDAADAEPA